MGKTDIVNDNTKDTTKVITKIIFFVFIVSIGFIEG